MKKVVYLDHASTTPVEKEVLEKMMPYFSENYGNANSQHILGRNSMSAVDNARDTISEIINCKPNELYFTSGGTEADNWAIKGVAFANQEKGKHIVISAVEHHAVIESVKFLQKQGFTVDYARVNKDGVVDVEYLKSIIRKDTTLVCVMMANNEVGTIQPIKEICKIAHDNGAYMFTDAVQAMGVLDIDVKELGVDILSFSSHKIYGPKGVGALYVKNGTRIENLISGGHQERTKRGGTTNVAGVVGFGEALKIANKNRETNFSYVLKLRDYFIQRIENEIESVSLNGDRKNRLPANANFCFNGISGEELLFNLDLEGVCASSGSACSSGSIEPSHVLLAMGMSQDNAKSSVRFTLGKDNTKQDVDYAVGVIKQAIDKMERSTTLFKLEQKHVKV